LTLKSELNGITTANFCRGSGTSDSLTVLEPLLSNLQNGLQSIVKASVVLAVDNTTRDPKLSLFFQDTSSALLGNYKSANDTYVVTSTMYVKQWQRTLLLVLTTVIIVLVLLTIIDDSRDNKVGSLVRSVGSYTHHGDTLHQFTNESSSNNHIQTTTPVSLVMINTDTTEQPGVVGKDNDNDRPSRDGYIHPLSMYSFQYLSY
jgi:hypothetical protein